MSQLRIQMGEMSTFARRSQLLGPDSHLQVDVALGKTHSESRPSAGHVMHKLGYKVVPKTEYYPVSCWPVSVTTVAEPHDPFAIFGTVSCSSSDLISF